MKHRRGLWALAALALAIAVPVAAMPAVTAAQPDATAAKRVTPRKNAAFSLNCGRSSTECLGNFGTSRNGRTLVGLHFVGAECGQSSIPGLMNKKIRVSRSGRFRVSDTFEDLEGKQITVSVRGRFSRSTLARGTYKITSEGCEDETRRFTARYDRNASRCCKVSYRGGQVIATGTLSYPRSADFLYAPGCKAREGRGRARVTLKRDRDGFVRGYHTIAYVYRYRGKIVTRESAPFYVRGTADR